MKALTEAKQQNLEVSRKQSSEIHSPMFSVIVPVYNVAPYLNECLDSVLAQTFTDWECLCTDDGSHDASGTILDSYARRDARFHVTHQCNRGVSSARNRALDATSGEWICFLDADDVIHMKLLESCKEKSEGVEANIITYNAGYGVEVCFPPLRVEQRARIWTNAQQLTSELLNGGFGEKVYHREYISTIRFKSYQVGEDRLFSTQCLCEAKCIVQLQTCLYWYRARQGSAMLSPLTIRKVADSFETGYKMLLLLLSCGNKVPYRAVRGECVRIFEKAAYGLSLLKREERDSFFEKWCAELRKLGREHGLSWWYRLVFSVCGTARLWWLSVLLGAFPFRLKLLRQKIRLIKG